MRIAMIGPFGLEPKGTMSARALPLAKALIARGHQVRVIMPPWHTPQRAGERWRENGVELEYVCLGPKGWPLSPLSATWRLVKRALDWRPDVIHCFKPKAYAGLAAWLVWHAQRLGLTQARLIVDEDDWEGAGGWNELEPYPALLKRFFAWQEGWGLTHNQGLVVASRALETIAWSRGIHPRRVHYVPNGGRAGSRTDGQDVRETRGLGQAPVILLYTRFFEYAPERAARVFSLVAAAVPQVRLLIVGEALFPADKVAFDSAIAHFGLEDRVCSVGWDATWPESGYLDRLLASADCAIYPMDDSLINRTKCPAKLVTLLFAGIPVVADDIGQIGEYIAQFFLGDVVLAGDAEAMAQKVIARLGQAESERNVALASRRIVWMQERFGWDHLCLALETAYLQSAKD